MRDVERTNARTAQIQAQQARMEEDRQRKREQEAADRAAKLAAQQKAYIK